MQLFSNFRALCQDILDVCKENDILVQAYAPLGSSEKFQKGGKKVLENEVLVNMARDKDCTVAQIALSWALSKGHSGREN